MSRIGSENPQSVTVRQDQSLSTDDLELYWQYVKEALHEVFGKDKSLADEARERLENVEREKQEPFTLFYHASPFEVAADLAGQGGNEITIAQRKAYQKLLKRWKLADQHGPDRYHLEALDPED